MHCDAAVTGPAPGQLVPARSGPASARPGSAGAPLPPGQVADLLRRVAASGAGGAATTTAPLTAARLADLPVSTPDDVAAAAATGLGLGLVHAGPGARVARRTTAVLRALEEVGRP